MLRRFLLYLSTAAWARSIVTHLGLDRRVALRFVAGETVRSHSLGRAGRSVTLRATAPGTAGGRISLGEVTGTILPASP